MHVKASPSSPSSSSLPACWPEPHQVSVCAHMCVQHSSVGGTHAHTHDRCAHTFMCAPQVFGTQLHKYQSLSMQPRLWTCIAASCTRQQNRVLASTSPRGNKKAPMTMRLHLIMLAGLLSSLSCCCCCCYCCACALLQPLHQSVLVEGAEEDEAPAAAEGDEETVGLEGLLAQVCAICCGWQEQNTHHCKHAGIVGRTL